MRRRRQHRRAAEAQRESSKQSYLKRDDITIGTVKITDCDNYWLYAEFKPTPAFEEYRSLFERESEAFRRYEELSAALDSDPSLEQASEDAQDAWFRALEDIYDCEFYVGDEERECQYYVRDLKFVSDNRLEFKTDGEPKRVRNE